MPQLMPLNWIMSIMMFLFILLSMCWVFSVKSEKKEEDNMYQYSELNMWFW